jgi:Bacterial PH domain
VIRRYRVPAGQLVPALVGAGLFLLVGLGGIGQPWRQVGVAGVIVAFLAVGVGAVAVAMVLTTRVILTPAEISYRSSLRRGAIPWASVLSFRVGRARSWANWSCVVVDVSGRGDVRIPITGSRSYVERVITEIEAFRAGLGAGVSGVRPA